MAIVQCMTHFNSLCLVDTMRKSGFTMREILEYSSPVFRLGTDMSGRILNQDAELYSDIEIMNKEGPKAIRRYIGSAKSLQEIIRKKDKKRFERLFDNAARFVGNYKKDAMEESDHLIKQMVKRR